MLSAYPDGRAVSDAAATRPLALRLDEDVDERAEPAVDREHERPRRKEGNFRCVRGPAFRPRNPRGQLPHRRVLEFAVVPERPAPLWPAALGESVRLASELVLRSDLILDKYWQCRSHANRFVKTINIITFIDCS